MSNFIAGIIELLYSGDVAIFLKSLLLGDKTEFYQNAALYVSMSRAGIMHIVAISGLHVSFIVSFVKLVFGNSKKYNIISLLLVWVFVFITGFSPSALRAAIMLTSALLAPIFKRESDSLRSLIIAAVLIIIFDVQAIKNISFQLSFGATAGIILFSNPIYFKLISKFGFGRFRSYLFGVISSSLSVMVITIPITAYHFNSIQLLSPIANIFILWAVSLCFILGFVSIFIGALSPIIATPFVYVVQFLVKYIFFIAKQISNISFSNLYLCNSYTIFWIILLYVVLIGAYLFRKKFLFPALISIFTLFFMLLSIKYSYSNLSGLYTVVNVGQGQSIVAISQNSTVVVDCGNTGTINDAGEITGQYLLSRGRSDVDLLVLTHLHKDHCDGVPFLLEYIDVKKIAIPYDIQDDDGMLEIIKSSAESHGTEVIYIYGDTQVNYNNLNLFLMSPMESGDSNEKCMMVLISLDNRDILITGDAGKTAEHELLDSYNIKDIDFLIVGHHGSKYSTSEELLKTVGSHTAIISTGENGYGHPTYETLSLLNNFGYNIYRTDLNGNIEIRINEQKR